MPPGRGARPWWKVACGHLDPLPPGWRQAVRHLSRPIRPPVHLSMRLCYGCPRKPILSRAPSSPPSSQGSCCNAVSPSLHTRSRPEGTLLGRKGRRRPGPVGRAGPPRTPGGWSPTRRRCGDPHARPASGRGILLKGFHSTQAFSSKASDCLMQGQPGRGSTSCPGGAEAQGSDMQQPSRQDKLRRWAVPGRDRTAALKPSLRSGDRGLGMAATGLPSSGRRRGRGHHGPMPPRPAWSTQSLGGLLTCGRSSQGPGEKGRKLGPVTLTDHRWAAVHHSPCPAAPAPAPVLPSARPSLHLSS